MTQTPPAFSFDTFHHATQATFSPCTPPPREPDHVSPSRSVYWDLGWGVVRSSDHWVGLDGCTHQATCRWDLHNDPGPPGFRTGACPYAGFLPYRPPRPTLVGGARDAAIAAWFLEQGGACTQGTWDAAGWGLPPAWVRKAWATSPAATAAAIRILHGLPPQTKALCASEAALQAAVRGHPIPWP